ncbi:MAG: hypothetical protein WD794_06575 [Mycobacteriales bacterium]
MRNPEPASPALGPAATAASYALVLVLTLLFALWGAFLVPLRVGGVPLPVSWLLAAVGNGAVGWAGGRLLGRPGAALPGLLWLAVALTLGSQRAEGDLIVPGTLPGVVFLLVGAVASAVAYGLAGPRRAA